MRLSATISDLESLCESLKHNGYRINYMENYLTQQLTIQVKYRTFKSSVCIDIETILWWGENVAPIINAIEELVSDIHKQINESEVSEHDRT